MLTVLGERVREVGCAHTSRLLRYSILLLQHVLLLADLAEPRVLQSLARRYAVICVINQQFLD